ncbi:hypothetical protein DL89DRAFT_289735 [Linderina pennispora]|uniref:ARM repeat-containing protein n=1 Tax=Linderina pennispora TaxID=61395 RepID=A0A1Y1WKU6_9FUNG|nr:uncharacterized protein DL89DRAFT_289735 [Linderina pennispora]ORX74103.1 hypothetical protein DL89DRAFT_289735 [Linderina pennispora]
MSDQIVDDTRHEKDPTAITECRPSPSGSWVTSFELLAATAAETWNTLNVEHSNIIQWVIENADSQHALVRFACLYFVRQAAEIHDKHSESLLVALGYQGYVLRRLLDASHFIVAEACKLVSVLVSVSSDVDERLKSMIGSLASRAFDRQSSAQKKALLSVAGTLLQLGAGARDYVCSVVPLIGLRPYLLDEERLVRDQALDIYEVMVRTNPGSSYAEMFTTLSPRGSAQVLTRVDILVALRGLAAMVKGLGASECSGRSAADVLKAIAYTAVSILADLQNVRFPLVAEESIYSYPELQQISLCAVLNQVSIESARIARDYSQVFFDQPIFEKSQQLLSTVLDAAVKSLKLAKHLVANFSIGSSGVKALLMVALEIIGEQAEFEAVLFGQFARALVSAMRTRLADVEWEARDTVLEIVHAAVETIEWGKVAPVIGDMGLIQDVVNALEDPEEYIRASGAQALVSIVEHADQDVVRAVVDCNELDAAHLRALIGDSEAFVRRAALELDLYQLADNPDFEVRVRLARVLARLAPLTFQYVEELQPGTLLIDMCRDSSRYVRRVCLDSLTGMKGSLEAAGVSASKKEQTKRRVVVSSQASFYSKLCEIDFARLEAGLTTEHLYQEALDTQVEDELMQETGERNQGNNILECY